MKILITTILLQHDNYQQFTIILLCYTFQNNTQIYPESFIIFVT